MSICSTDISKFKPFDELCFYVPKLLFGAAVAKGGNRSVVYFFKYGSKIYALEEAYAKELKHTSLLGYEVTDFDPNKYSYFYKKTDKPNSEYVFDRIKDFIYLGMEEYIKHIDGLTVYTLDLSGEIHLDDTTIFGVDAPFVFEPISIEEVYEIASQNGFEFVDEDKKDVPNEDER